MKKQAMVALVLGVLLLAGNSWAVPVLNVGDIVTFQDSVGNGPGGQFSLYKSGEFVFETFCLEKNETLNFTAPFKIDAISDSASWGGSQGLGETLSGTKPSTSTITSMQVIFLATFTMIPSARMPCRTPFGFLKKRRVYLPL